MPVFLRTTLLLIASNVFMTFAWYAHLRNLNDRKWLVAAITSWGIALFEYLLQVPANRIGYTAMSLSQLKISTRGDHTRHLRPVCRFLHATADQARLLVGRASSSSLRSSPPSFLPR